MTDIYADLKARRQKLDAKAKKQFRYYHTKQLDECRRLIAGYNMITPHDDEHRLVIADEIIRLRTLAKRHLKALAEDTPRPYRDYADQAREREAIIRQHLEAEAKENSRIQALLEARETARWEQKRVQDPVGTAQLEALAKKELEDYEAEMIELDERGRPL